MLKQPDITSWIETRLYLRQTLNEVLNGFQVDYEAQLHASRERIAALSPRLDHMSTERMLSPDDALLLLRISRLSEQELGDSDFFTRVGYTLPEARQIDARLEKIAAGTVPEKTHAAAS